MQFGSPVFFYYTHNANIKKFHFIPIRYYNDFCHFLPLYNKKCHIFKSFYFYRGKNS